MLWTVLYFVHNVIYRDLIEEIFSGDQKCISRGYNCQNILNLDLNVKVFENWVENRVMNLLSFLYLTLFQKSFSNIQSNKERDNEISYHHYYIFLDVFLVKIGTKLYILFFRGLIFVHLRNFNVLFWRLQYNPTF